MNWKSNLGLGFVFVIILIMLAIIWAWANGGLGAVKDSEPEVVGTSTEPTVVESPEGNKLCRAISGTLPEPTDSAYDPSLTEPLRCLTVLHPNQEPIELTLTKMERGIELGIGRFGQVVQRIEIAGVDRFYPGDILLSEDLNFDNYKDLRLLNNRGAANQVFDYWLFDPSAGQFVKDGVLSGLFNPGFDPEAKTVSTYSADGWAGTLYTKRTYEWDGQKYSLAREEKAEAGEGETINTTVKEY